jgi:hypothetical protein
MLKTTSQEGAPGMNGMFPGGTCVGVLYTLVHDVVRISDPLLDLDPCTFKLLGVLESWDVPWESLGVGIFL